MVHSDSRLDAQLPTMCNLNRSSMKDSRLNDAEPWAWLCDVAMTSSEMIFDHFTSLFILKGMYRLTQNYGCYPETDLFGSHNRE